MWNEKLMQQTLLQKVIKYNKKYNMLQEGDGVLVGLSGGADSVCLLYILKDLAEKLHFSLYALHVNHGIRGTAADADEQFVTDLCSKLNVPFISIKEDIVDYAKKNRVSLEEGGRIVRYAALERVKQEWGCNKIALAHHANDSAETMLFHLFRGGKLAGLAGIPPVRGSIIRPLLCCGRKEIETWLKERNISYCTDASNFSEDYTRNKIRHRMITYAEEEINPKTVLHMQQTAEYIRQVKEFVEEETKRLFEKAVQKKQNVYCVSIPVLSEASLFLQQQLIYQLLGELGGLKDVTELHVTQVLSLMEKQSGRCVNLAGGILAEHSYDTVLLWKKQEEKEEPERLVNIPGQYVITLPMKVASHIKDEVECFAESCRDLTEYSEAFLVFSVFPYVNTMKIPKNRYTKWMDYDKIKDAIILRKRQPGDMFSLKNGTKTIKTFFIDEKIPKEERNQITLVACGKEILWIPGMRGSEAYPVGEQTKNILQIELKPKEYLY